MNFIDSIIQKTYDTPVKAGITPHTVAEYFTINQSLKKLVELFKSKDAEKIASKISDILELKISPEDLVGKTPVDILITLYAILGNNRHEADVVFNKPNPKPESVLEWSYEYEGRDLAVWISSFAEKFGWSIDQILQLPITTAFYLYQEIIVSNFHEREQAYSLTELAYPYDQGSKTQKYKPYPKPHWMTTFDKNPIQKIRVNKKFIPYGVVNVSGYPTVSNDEVPEERTDQGEVTNP